MGFFWHSLPGIIDSFKNGKSVPSNEPFTLSTFFEIIGCLLVIALFAGWYIGLPCYIHYVLGYTGWATFGIWCVLTVVIGLIVSFFNKESC